MDLFLDKGPYIDVKVGDLGENALQVAPRCDRTYAVQYLLNRRADIHALSSDYNKNDLQLAISQGNSDAVRLLLDAGASFDSKYGPCRETAL